MREMDWVSCTKQLRRRSSCNGAAIQRTVPARRGNEGMNDPATRTAERNERGQGTAGEVFGAFLKLGLTSFGGPIAHLGYFRDELVVRRCWIDEAGYAGLVALCQFLPGPASSQVGF